jgi:myo-inositol catabolism protein IolC
LVDEEFGAAIARSAKVAGFTLAMPVEQTGRQEFEFGEELGAHIDVFDPTFAKVHARYNPDGDAQVNSRQEAGLAANKIGKPTSSSWIPVQNGRPSG